ncbi:porin [Solimicrobium silvestre]|uniref:Gram-negative porin n=1 Tax=Solimicrobium silvestre TaxID=2099400 RepID=A0A2S9H0Z0_9BURK|nr:porin [Solimicrobium silvestre]PRC93652.1 Gram-negative porin [Solimicrobium silvestre]
MKKSLLAIAVLASFAGAASAQSSVTVFGTLDAGMTYANTGTQAPLNTANDKWSMDSGVSQASFIGFKGVEDLGGNLKAIFQLEAGIQIDNGTSSQANTLFNRASWVGLSGDFGTVTAGRQFTPLYEAVKTIDPFQLGMAGSASNLMSTGGASIVNGAIVAGNSVTNVAQNNSLRYASQSVSGLSAIVNYSFGEQAGNTNAGRDIGATVNYANGPLSLLVSYDGVKTLDDTTTLQTTLLGGVADWAQFGFPLKTSIGYAINKGSDVVGVADVDSRDLIIGLRLPMAQHEVLASFVHKDDKTTADLNAEQFALGYTYAISKRTVLYTSVSKMINKNGAAYTVGNASNTGYGVKVFDFGIRHSF